MKKYMSALVLTSLVVSTNGISQELTSHQNTQKQKTDNLKNQKKVLDTPQKLKVETVERNEAKVKRKSYPRGVIETH